MYLVLSRQVDEVIQIGDDIAVMVVRIQGDKVRLGISAPKHIPVHRKEVAEAIQREKEAERLEQMRQEITDKLINGGRC